MALRKSSAALPTVSCSVALPELPKALHSRLSTARVTCIGSLCAPSLVTQSIPSSGPSGLRGAPHWSPSKLRRPISVAQTLSVSDSPCGLGPSMEYRIANPQIGKSANRQIGKSLIANRHSPFVYSFIRSFAHSLIRSFAHSFIRSFAHSPFCSLFIGSLFIFHLPPFGTLHVLRLVGRYAALRRTTVLGLPH